MMQNSMDVSSQEYVRAFVQAAESVLGEVLGTPPTKGTPALQKSPLIDLAEVNVIIGITGDLQGLVNFGMDMATALAIASTMAMETLDELDELSISALQEMANMIAGNARFALQSKKVKSEISIPSLLIGKQMRTTWHRIRSVSVPLGLPFGQIVAIVGLYRLKGDAK